MRCWTAYWTREIAENNATGEPINHTSGNGFRDRGVQPGDRVFVISYFDRSLHVLGAMTVEKIVSQAAAEREFKQSLYDATDHLIARSPRNQTPLRLDKVVSKSDLRRIEFIPPSRKPSRKVKSVTKEDGSVSVQSITRTSVREITPATAQLFERVLAGR